MKKTLVIRPGQIFALSALGLIVYGVIFDPRHGIRSLSCVELVPFFIAFGFVMGCLSK